MTIDQVRKLHRAHPFQPFRIRLGDSRSLVVSHPERLAINPGGRNIIVVTGDEYLYEVVKFSFVKQLELLKAQRKPRK